MADIRCSQCGKDNPDFLDVCQFCQSPLKPESSLHIGEKPTKKHTGELEGVLPDWLKNARQQARDSAEEDAANAASQPKPKKEEPVDLLAGLFQPDSSEEEDVPDWLSSINQDTKGKPAVPAKPEPEPDFFAQFNKPDDAGAKSETFSTPQRESSQPLQDSGERDELSAWFSRASEQSSEPFDSGQDTSLSHSDWGVSSQAPLHAGEPPTEGAPEDLSWLHNLENISKQTDELKAPKPAADWEREFNAPSQSSDQDDLSWLNNLGAPSATEQASTPPAQPSQSQDDLSWLDQLGGTPLEQSSKQAVQPTEDLSWLDAFKPAPSPSQAVTEPPPSSKKEDLSWLNDLGAVPEEPSAAEPSRPQEDLSWLNALGESASFQQPAPTQPSSQEGTSWLDNFGATPLEQAPAQPEKPQEDLSWLNAFGADAGQKPSTPAASSGDLDWLNNLGSPSSQEPASPESSMPPDLGWLNNLQGSEPETSSAAPFAEPSEQENVEDLTHVSPFMARKTAPLENETDDSMPDWLKSATEGPSMPMGASALEQFREDYKVPTGPTDTFSWKSFTQDVKPAQEQSPFSDFFPAHTVPKAASLREDAAEPVTGDPSPFPSGSSSSVPSAEDVNSLFAIDMPDWLTQEEPAKQEDTAQPVGINAEGGEALSPADLPSWVQAMRPMDAVIVDAVPSLDDQPTEREGPLAGFRGLIPVLPVGSARRPKSISLKLQASDEQQASAAIFEQLLAGETSPRPLASTAVYTSQRTLRWAISALLLAVLGFVIAVRPQIFPPTATLAAGSSDVVNRLQGIPESADVLVVLDYDPAMAGELESVSGPLLDRLVMLRHPRFSFVSTSPNGPALVERLMLNTNIRQSSNSDNLNYTSGQDYFNLGFLPGAESGVLNFIQSPKTAFSSATVDGFSGYSAVLVLTDNANSARTWIEQIQAEKEQDPALTLQPLVVAASAQAAPMLQPYFSSQQIHGLIAGIADASRFEFQNGSRPGIAISYLNAFGAGLALALVLITLGSLWSLVAGIRARRTEVPEG
jgi:hypothetical protein